jgi:hypothetical protein
MARRFLRFWFAPIDPIRLDTFRILLGIALLIYFQNRWMYAAEWLTPQGFHVSRTSLPYHSFWVPLLPAAALPWFGFLFFGSIIALILGWKVNYMLWITEGLVIYVTAADQFSAFSPNKIVIVALAVLAVGYRGRNKSKPAEKNYQSAWPLRILQITLVIHYFSAGWSKAFWGEWLREPFVLWTVVQGAYRTEFAAWLVRHLPLGAWPLIQYLVLVFELTVPFTFTVKRYRTLGPAMAFLFQLCIALTMYQLVFFGLIVCCFHTLFFEDKVFYRLKALLENLRLSSLGMKCSP